MATRETDRLESWKEIANFLGRDERTAMRWAKERDMPVHRLPGGKRSGVYSSRKEITAWMQAHSTAKQESDTPTGSELPDTNTARKKPIFAAVATVAACLILAIALIIRLYSASHRGRPEQVKFTQRGLEVFDESGHKLWTHDFAKILNPEAFPKAGDYQSLNELTRIDDFFADGDREVLVVVPLLLGPNPQDLYQTEADMFTSSGKLLWSYVPQKTYQFGDHRLDGPWEISTVFVSDKHPKKVIWISAIHYMWGNTFVSELDAATGAESVRFLNTGGIHTLNEIRTSHRTFLLAGGFNNEYDSSSLAIIDESNRFAVSPQTAGTRHECVSCEKGNPDYYLVFPRAEINRYKKVYENRVGRIDVSKEGIEIYCQEMLNVEGVEAVYSVQVLPTIEAVSLRFGSDYDMLHRELSAQKILDHSLENCPERLHPKPVRVWTPAAGWVDLSIKAAKASD
jgi:hypothetical protein